MIGIAGLSHLGINTAAALAAKGFDVAGYDGRASQAAQLAQGRPGFFEPGLVELLAEQKSRLQFTSDIRQLEKCDVVVFALDVATDDAGRSDTSALEQLIDDVIQQAANRNAVYVLLSQVTPGFTRRLVERYRQKTPLWNYQVETLVFGNAVERALRPERFIIGCADPKQPLPPAFERVLSAFDCPILPMRYESAELAKISINLFLVSSVSVTNTLAEVCEGIGADWSEIAPALKLDRRIGPNAYLSPGLGIAGGNLERDLATVTSLAEQHGGEASVIDAWRINSRHRREWALEKLHQHVLSQQPSARIAVWGIAYKIDTTSTKNSPAVHFIDALPNTLITAYDPQASLPARQNFRQVCSALEACDGAAALAILTPWKEFVHIDPATIRARLSGHVVIDPYGVLNSDQCRASGLEHYRLGTSPPRGES